MSKSRDSGLMRFLPRRVGAQIFALVIAAALFTYAENTLLLQRFDPPPNGGPAMSAGNIMFSAMPILSETVPEKRQSIVDLVNLMAPALNMSIIPDVEIPATATQFGPGTDAQATSDNPPPRRDMAKMYRLGEIVETANGRLSRTLAVLPDGTGIHALLPMPPEPPPALFSPQFMMGNWLVLLVIVLPAALIWGIVSVSRPLRRFADAAEEFSIDGPYAPLPETGPEEIQVAARALNTMRNRIAIMTADRTRMLSAVGHDLRTPVTRMRLRAEFIEDEDIRAGQLRDLARMETMIDNTLSYLRDGQAPGARAPNDLASLMQTLIDDYADLESEVGLTAPERLVATIEPDAFRRMIENLVQNGLKFGTRVEVTLMQRDDRSIEIRVEDNGPGIPEAERLEMLKPFITGDSARSGNRSGFGLGLSIAEAIARAHGGALDLGESSLGGLQVRITLPSGANPT